VNLTLPNLIHINALLSFNKGGSTPWPLGFYPIKFSLNCDIYKYIKYKSCKLFKIEYYKAEERNIITLLKFYFKLQLQLSYFLYVTKRDPDCILKFGSISFHTPPTTYVSSSLHCQFCRDDKKQWGFCKKLISNKIKFPTLQTSVVADRFRTITYSFH
jgi:hypothetical protein